MFILYWGFLWGFFLTGGLFRATSMAYGSSRAKGRIGAATASLYHSHRSARSEPSLQPTDLQHSSRQPTDRGQESNTHPHVY